MRPAAPLAAALFLALAACAPAYRVADPGPAFPGMAPEVPAGPSRTPADFTRVATRVEPVAEAFCREAAPAGSPAIPPGHCDFAIVLEDDPKMPPNAFQTRIDGRPVVVVSDKLLAEMRSDDEIAFVLSHEASHQIANHLSKQASSSMLGALIVGGLAQANAGPEGISDEGLRRAMDLGAFVGGRAYSQSYELEADWIGAFVTARAGYDPEKGAAVFGRPSLAGAGGPVLLSTHPASPQRQATIAAAAEEIRRQRAEGLEPTPSLSGRLF